VSVEKFGIEGLLVVEDNLRVDVTPEADEAVLSRSNKVVRRVKVFDRLNVQIRAEMVEFRRSVNLVFRE